MLQAPSTPPPILRRAGSALLLATAAALAWPEATAQQLSRRAAPSATTPTASGGGGQRSGDLNVQPPPLWYSGDTHEHVQLCPTFPPYPPGSIGALPYDRPLLDVYQEMVNKALNVSAISFWRPLQDTEPEFFAEYVPRITGVEDPLTTGDANHVIQLCVETSGFATSIRGHLLGLGISDGNFDPEADYPAPNLDFFRAQAGAVAGYAHQAWPNELTNARGYVGVDYRCMTPTGMDFPNVVALWGAAAPVYAPMDAAYQRLDFLESVDLELVVPGNISWTGMWYRLLSAGVPVQAVAGTDTNCWQTVSGADPRTYVQIDADPLDFGKWLDGLRTGNLSMAMGPSQFLELRVDGQPCGSELYLSSSSGATVQAEIELTVAAGITVDDTLELLVDGEVYDSYTFTGLSGGTETFVVDVPITESCWLTARTSSLRTHTGFVEAYLDAKPIVDCESDEYFVLYGEYLQWFLDLADSQGMVEDFVGDSETEIRAYIDGGAEVFALHRAYDLPLPAGFTRLIGQGTPSCEGPIGAVTRAPAATAGTTVRIECFDAPRMGAGWLMVGPSGVPAGYDQNGATVYVANDANTVLYDVLVDDRGVAYADVPLPTGAGQTLFAQFVFATAPTCTTGTWSASEALRIFTQ